MLKKLQMFITNQKGMETIEFIIVIPLLIFLVFGSISFMLAIYAKIAVVDAAKEGARSEALGAAAASDTVKKVLRGFNLRAEFLDSVTVDTNEENNSQYVSVKVVYRQPSLFPGLSKLMNVNNSEGYFTLSSMAIFKKESP